MSTENTATPTPETTITPSAFEALGAAIAKGIRDTTRPKVTIGEYQRSRPKKLDFKFTHVFQNGYELSTQTLTNEEIAGLNSLSHSGRYFDRKFEVIVREEGNDRTLELRYPCASIDKRLEMQQYFNSFPSMVSQLSAFQKEERTDREALEDAKRMMIAKGRGK